MPDDAGGCDQVVVRLPYPSMYATTLAVAVGPPRWERRAQRGLVAACEGSDRPRKGVMGGKLGA